MVGEAVDRAFEEAVSRGAFPGAVLSVHSAGRSEVRAYGSHGGSGSEPTTADTVFDLSSLTKPLATTTAVMLLIADGALSLEEPAASVLPSFAAHEKGAVTLRQLLCHSSGLAAWRPYFEEVRATEMQRNSPLLGTAGGKQWVYDAVCREPLEASPGSRAKYSDLGFIALGAIVEEVSGQTLDRFCDERIFRPLDLDSLRFFAVAADTTAAEMIAPTEDCPWRGRVLRGVVHDDNAYVMGGVAGHAGLFGTAQDVDRLAGALVAAWRGHRALVPQSVIREFWRMDGTVPDSTWGLGWDTPSPAGSLAGRGFSSQTFGHLGFTGTSLWIDLAHDRRVVLLSNRVHPTRNNDAIRDFRPRIHDLVNAELDDLAG